MKVLSILSIIFFSTCSNAVVKRHDVPAKNYLLAEAPEYLIDMPHEGHGVLINPQWILTVAHTIFYDYSGKKIKVGSKNIEIEKVYIHPSYIEADKTLFKGDAAPLMNFLMSRSDIALVKLSTPVKDLKPIEIYSNSDELGKEITVYGRGATGNGKTGENSETKPLRELNYFKNIVEATDDKWLSFKFDEAQKALPLEGIHGSGDSGGPSVIFDNGIPYLVGLSSWQIWQGDLALFKGGLYGTTAYQVRVSNYRDWIVSVVGS
ncbi:S1 family peptidase [Pseudoalteromonas spongiae]|uniref:S1 family peptidase n=1 Tax=Pseudoalteromonas spongiae TaxID=298657 RepID=UPI000C2D2C90|nr:trypsin-like serine protease [Pseudoalteromonas spongiae]